MTDEEVNINTMEPGKIYKAKQFKVSSNDAVEQHLGRYCGTINKAPKNEAGEFPHIKNGQDYVIFFTAIKKVDNVDEDEDDDAEREGKNWSLVPMKHYFAKFDEGKKTGYKFYNSDLNKKDFNHSSLSGLNDDVTRNIQSFNESCAAPLPAGDARTGGRNRRRSRRKHKRNSKKKRYNATRKRRTNRKKYKRKK